MTYRLEFTRKALESLNNLPKNVQKQFTLIINGLETNPFPPQTKQLKASKGFPKSYRLRKGDYRLIYTLDSKLNKILILQIGHRKDIYR